MSRDRTYEVKLTLQWVDPPEPQPQTVNGLATIKFNHAISSLRLFMNTLIIAILICFVFDNRSVLPMIGEIDSLHSWRYVLVQWETQFKKIYVDQLSIMKTSSQYMYFMKWEIGDYQIWIGQITDFERETVAQATIIMSVRDQRENNSRL